MYAGLPPSCDIGALSTPRHCALGAKAFRSQSDPKATANSNLNDWLLQQRCADPADEPDEDYELTTSSITVTEERSRRLTCTDPDEVLSPARPSPLDIAAAMAAVGTLTGCTRTSLSSKALQPAKRSLSPLHHATSHGMVQRRQHTGSGGAGSGARSMSPSWCRPATTASAKVLQSSTTPVSAPIPFVAPHWATPQSRARTSPFHRSSSRCFNNVPKGNDETVVTVVQQLSKANLATVPGARGVLSHGTAAPRAVCNSRQRKNFLEQLRNQSQALQAAAAGRQRPSPSRMVHAKIHAAEDAMERLGPWPSFLEEGSTISRATSPSAGNLYAQRSSTCAISPRCASVTAETSDVAAPWDLAARAVMATEYSNSPRPLSSRELQTEAPEASESPTATAAAVIPTIPLAAWLASSLTAADRDSSVGSNGVQCGALLKACLGEPQALYTTPAAREECGPNCATAVKDIVTSPEPSRSEAVISGAQGAGARDVTAAEAVVAVQGAGKRERGESPSGCALLQEGSTSFTAPVPAQLGGWVAVVIPGQQLHGAFGAAASQIHHSSNIGLEDSVRGLPCISQKSESETTMRLEAPNGPTAPTGTLGATITNISQPEMTCMATSKHPLFGLDVLDVINGASGELVRQLVAIVQSQAAQIKDLSNCLAASRVGSGTADCTPQDFKHSPLGAWTGNGEERKVGCEAKAVGEAMAGRKNDGGACESGIGSAEVRISCAQLLASRSSTTTHYHDSVGSLRSSREVHELGGAVNRGQDAVGRGTPGCIGGLQDSDSPSGPSANVIQSETSTNGGSPAAAAATATAGLECHPSAEYDACTAEKELNAVAVNGWWITYGPGSAAREQSGAVVRGEASVDAGFGAGSVRPSFGSRPGSPQASLRPGMHQVIPMSPITVVVPETGGGATGAVSNQLEMPALRSDVLEEGVRTARITRSSVPWGALAASHEFLPCANVLRESISKEPWSRFRANGGVEASVAAGNAGWPVGDDQHQQRTCLLGPQHQNQNQQRKQQPVEDFQGKYLGDEGDPLQPFSTAALLSQRCVQGALSGVGLKDGMFQKRDQVSPNHSYQPIQPDNFREGRLVQHQEQGQEQDRGLCQIEEMRGPPQLQASWTSISDNSPASLRFEVRDLRQRLSLLEAAAIQQQLLLQLRHREDQIHDLQHQRNSQQGGQYVLQEQEEPEKEQLQQQQQEQQQNAGCDAAPCSHREETQPSFPRGLEKQHGQQQEHLDLPQCGIEIGLRAQEQDLRISSLMEEFALLQLELRRQGEVNREVLDQLAQGMEQITSCMLSTLLPGADTATAAAVAAPMAATPLPASPMNQTLLLATSAESSAGALVTSPVLEPTIQAGRTSRSVTSTVIAAKGSSIRACISGHPASPLHDNMRRQLHALQQEIRRMRAVMAAQVFVTAVARADGSGNGNPLHTIRQREGLSPRTVASASSRWGLATVDRDVDAERSPSSMYLYAQHRWEEQQQQHKELQKQVQQLRQEVSELRCSEALAVEAQEALVELVNDIRRDVDMMRPGKSYTPDLAALPRDGSDGWASSGHEPAAPVVDSGNRSRRLLQELCPPPLMGGLSPQKEQPYQESQSVSRASPEPCQQQQQHHDEQQHHHLPLPQQQQQKQQQLSADLYDDQHPQPQSDKISQIVEVIQNVNAMLNGSLLQAMAKIRAQGEEIEELKRCMTWVIGGQQPRIY